MELSGPELGASKALHVFEYTSRLVTSSSSPVDPTSRAIQSRFRNERRSPPDEVSSRVDKDADKIAIMSELGYPRRKRMLREVEPTPANSLGFV